MISLAVMKALGAAIAISALCSHSAVASAVIKEARIGEVATGVRNNQVSSRVVNVIVADVRHDKRTAATRVGIIGVCGEVNSGGNGTIPAYRSKNEDNH